MAKFKLEKKIGELSLFHYNYDAASMAVTSQSATKLEIADMDGDKVVYTGTGFTFDGDEATAGKVKKVEFFNADGDLLLTITDASFKLAALSPTDVLFNFSIFEKGNDTFKGSSAGDWIMYGDNRGNDKIYGLGGNDYILGSDGKNLIDGGKGGKDVLTYSLIDYAENPNVKGVKVDLAKGEAINPWGDKDTIVGIEDVRGTRFADTFVGTKKNEHFAGVEGNDRMTGGKGNDSFDFSRGWDKDKITDFGKGDDSVELSGLGVANFGELKGLMEQKGKNVVIDFGHGDVLTFLDVDKSDFTKDDFTIYQW